MLLFRKILNNSIWLLLGTSIGRLAMFLTNIFAARILPIEVFGQFTTVRNTISMLESFISGGIGSTATKHVAEARNEETKATLINSLFLINISVVLVFTILILIFGDFIARTYFVDSNEMKNALYIGVFILIFTTLSTLTQSILIGFEVFRKLAFVSFVVSLLSIPLIFILIAKFRLYGAIGGVSLYFLIDFFLKLYFFRDVLFFQKHVVYDINEVFKHVKALMLFSLPLFLAIVLNSVSFWYARILLINSTKSFVNIAVFDAAFQWLTIIMIITSATTSVALPMFSRAYSLNNKTRILKIFKINLYLNLVIAISIAGIFMLFSKTIMSLYGEEYREGSDILIILSLTSVFFTLATLYNRFMMSINRTGTLLIVAVLGTISLYLVLFFFGISSISLAWAFLAYYCTSVLYYFIMKLKYKID